MSDPVAVGIDDMDLDYQAILMCREKRKIIDEVEDAAKERIKARLKDQAADDAQIGGKTVITWRSSTKRVLDQAKLKADFPDAYAACRKSTTGRRFCIADESEEKE